MISLASYPLNGLALPWGLTLAEATARLKAQPQLPPFGGWPNLRVACRSVFGLAATEANLRAPALHKPVLQVSYELAAPPQFRGQPREAAQWQQSLTALLGAPGQTQAYTEPWRTNFDPARHGAAHARNAPRISHFAPRQRRRQPPNARGRPLARRCLWRGGIACTGGGYRAAHRPHHITRGRLRLLTRILSWIAFK
jgi:hypothetical protein